jgi:SAM-dependent methyltransferase
MRALYPALRMTRVRPSRLPDWPRPFDPDAELDWGDPAVGRRLLREHLDQEHDGASRRAPIIEKHLTRLRRLLPRPPADILDAGCGPGLYSVPLAASGYAVVGIDNNDAALRHARRLARKAASGAVFRRVDLRALNAQQEFDTALLIYFVLEGFPRRTQLEVLRRLCSALRPRGRLLAELRVRPEHPRGRLSTWEVAPFSLFADRPHLLLTDTTWDDRRRVYVLREIAVLDDGSVTVRQTTGSMLRLEEVGTFFARAGLRIHRVYDGWSRHPATGLSETLLVVAERPAGAVAPG